MTFDGEVSFDNTATLTIELGGTIANDQFDQLLVSGALSLGGTLSVSLLNDFSPAVDQSFNILDWGTLSGTFSSLQLPALASGLEWDTSQLYTNGVLAIASITLPGDFNQDGAVNAADYVTWRNTDGTPAGYNAWRAHFGQTAGSRRQCECRRPRTDNVSEAHRGGCRHSLAASRYYLASAENSLTPATLRLSTILKLK